MDLRQRVPLRQPAVTPTQRGEKMSNHLIKGYYVAIPEDTIFSEEWKELAPTTRCIYTTMLTRYDRQGGRADGRVTWSQVELVGATGLSLRTVGRSIDELLDKEWISIWEPGGRWATGTTYDVAPEYADGQSPKPAKK